MDKFRLASVIFIAVFLVSCASRNTPISAKDFSAYEGEYYFLLNNNYQYSEKRGAVGIIFIQGLKSGKYEARFQDVNGVYFIGPSPAYCMGKDICDSFNEDGGIWVSKLDQNDIRVFFVQNTSFRTGSESPGLLLKLEDGKYFIHDKNESTSKELKQFKHAKNS